MHRHSKTMVHVIWVSVKPTCLKKKKADHISAQENKNKTINLRVPANDLLLTSVFF